MGLLAQRMVESFFLPSNFIQPLPSRPAPDQPRYLYTRRHPSVARQSRIQRLLPPCRLSITNRRGPTGLGRPHCAHFQRQVPGPCMAFPDSPPCRSQRRFPWPDLWKQHTAYCGGGLGVHEPEPETYGKQGGRVVGTCPVCCVEVCGSERARG